MNQESSSQNPRRITQADIAEACGVSKMTVSMALRKHPDIPEKTRQRIQRQAEKMGYCPDPMLSALSHYNSNRKTAPAQAALAWVNPYRVPKRLRSFTEFDLYWKGARAAAEKLGYQLEEFPTMEIPMPRLHTIFKTRRIQGILLPTMASPEHTDPDIDYTAMPWENYAVVRFGRRSTYPQTHYVTSAQASNTILAFDRIRALGYRRIGFVGIFARTKTFCGGVTVAQQSFPENERIPSLLFTSEDPIEFRRNKLIKWIRKNKPDAVLTDYPDILEFMKEEHIRVPEEIALAATTIHDTPFDAGIDQNPEEIGRAAVRMLAALINTREFGIPEIRNELLIEGRWVDGSMLPRRAS